MPAKFPLTAARRRVLKLLAGLPEGCTEAVLMAHGFSVGFLGGLIADGLVSERSERMGVGGREVRLRRLQITDAGRRVLT